MYEICEDLFIYIPNFLKMFRLQSLIFMFSCHMTPKSISRGSCFITKLTRISHWRVFKMHSFNMTKCFISTGSSKLTKPTCKKLPQSVPHNVWCDFFFAGSDGVCKILLKLRIGRILYCVSIRKFFIWLKWLMVENSTIIHSFCIISNLQEDSCLLI